MDTNQVGDQETLQSLKNENAKLRFELARQLRLIDKLTAEPYYRVFNWFGIEYHWQQINHFYSQYSAVLFTVPSHPYLVKEYGQEATDELIANILNSLKGHGLIGRSCLGEADFIMVASYHQIERSVEAIHRAFDWKHISVNVATERCHSEVLLENIKRLYKLHEMLNIPTAPRQSASKVNGYSID